MKTGVNETDIEYDHVYAFSDVHGQYDKLINAAKKIGLIEHGRNNVVCANNSLIVTNGDLLDRGPKSRQTVDFCLWLKLEAQKVGSAVKFVRGNHEDMFIKAIKNERWRDIWLYNGGNEAEASYPYNSGDLQSIYNHHEEYYGNLLSHFIYKETLFVHAGVSPNGSIGNLTTKEDEDQGAEAYLWIRYPFFNANPKDYIHKYGVKKIVFGHTPTFILGSDYKVTPLYDNQIIGIDCGAASGRNVGIVKFCGKTMNILDAQYSD